MSSNADTRSIGFNLPNQLTLARVVMVPIFVAVMSFHNYVCFAVGYVLFVVAVITDYYDGKIARDRNQVTNFGKLIDPLADKILMSAAFLMAMDISPLRIPAWTVVAILAREFLVTGIRTLAVTEGVVIPAEGHGKIKTAAQMTYILLFIPLAVVSHVLQGQGLDVAARYDSVVAVTSLWCAVGVALYTVYSGIHYLVNNWRVLHLGAQS
ncbi:MAG: putative CDP-diacylglycerol--glycerol-3-phosphate 3-phosphatidyl-transferase 2 [Candidatus Hydrogenedentota bacterium]